MHKHTILSILLILVTPTLEANEPRNMQVSEPGPREIYVPWKDLDQLLRDQPRRIMMSREQFEQLWQAAHEAEQQRPPHAASISSARYDIAATEDRALISAALTVDILEPGLHALPLTLSAVGLRHAALDDRDAAIGSTRDGRLTLFVEGTGQHRLTLEMVTAIESTAAAQILTFELPIPAATRLHLTMPGDVEIKGGAKVLHRRFDSHTQHTQFEVLPQRGPNKVELTLNSRLKREQRVVIARGVVIDEVTAGYERVHANFAMRVLHKPIEQLRFALPATFEITEVSATGMSQWAVQRDGERQILQVALRSPTAESVTLQLGAMRGPPSEQRWAFPKVEALDVQGQAAVLGVLLDQRIKLAQLESSGLIPINVDVLASALPDTFINTRHGAPVLRPVAAFYGAHSAFGLAAQLTQPPAELEVRTTLQLTLSDAGHTLQGGIALQPTVEPLGTFTFTIAGDWQVSTVTADGGSALPIERSTDDDGRQRVHVRLLNTLLPAQTAEIRFAAQRTPPGWLDDWQDHAVRFPTVSVHQASHTSGALSVSALDDFSVRPEQLSGLQLLDRDDKAAVGLGEVHSDLAFQFDDADYALDLRVERVAPRLSAATYALLDLQPDVLKARYELNYEVTEARAHLLRFSLPADTPEALSVVGLDGVVVKSFHDASAGSRRMWTVLLQDRLVGRVRIAVRFEQPRDSAAATNLELPMVYAEDVAYQSGIVAVEGSAELDVTLRSELAAADIGQLVDAEYQPGARLLGAYAFVGPHADVRADIARPAAHALPAVIVQRSELVSMLSAHGMSQSVMRCLLRTKLPFLELALPDDSTLWSVEINGQPAKPQREGNKLLLSLDHTTAAQLCDLRVVYETGVSAIDLSGTIDLHAPRLLSEDDSGTSVDVPMADLTWQVYVPDGLRVVQTAGSVATQDLRAPALAAVELARAVAAWSGGVDLFYRHSGLGLARAREMSRRVPHTPISRPQALEPQVSSSRGAGSLQADTESPIKKTEQRSADRVIRYGQGPSPADAWALEGVRSLKIDLHTSGGAMTFRSLADMPHVVVGLADTRRLDGLGLGLAAVVLLAGVLNARKPIQRQYRWPLIIAVCATLVPACVNSTLVTVALNPVFYAALAVLAVIAMTVPALRVFRYVTRGRSRLVPTAAAVACASLLPADAARAEDPPSDPAAWWSLMQPPAPLNIPDDAIILPYDPEAGLPTPGAAELLVPYDTYLRLQERLAPEAGTGTSQPAPFAWAGSTFSSTLSNDDHLRIDGRLFIDVFTDEAVAVPLALRGGVLSSARLNGSTARLSAAQPARREQRHADSQLEGLPATTLLHVHGRGRHELLLVVRLRIDRQGGWRVVRGQLPAAPATDWTLRVPHTGTEVRMRGAADRDVHVSVEPDEVLQSALAPNGEVDLRWRPKATTGQIDRSLTASSRALLDVQEDGLRLNWQLDLRFRGGERDGFAVRLPDDYVILRVDGPNVRGWSVSRTAESPTLDVVLLTPARHSEQLHIELWRAGTQRAFSAPLVAVEGAALHQGSMRVRCSPLLDVRTTTSSGLSRVDYAEIEGLGVGTASPLGIEPYRAYRFSATPFDLQLTAQPSKTRRTATIQAILRLSETRRHLETRFVFHAADRAVFELQALLPNDMHVESVAAPGDHEWDVAPFEGVQRLRVYLASGRLGDVPVVVRGSWPTAEAQVSLPTLRALDVDHQSGTLVVQTDPTLSVHASNLHNCKWFTGRDVGIAWLAPAQRRMARLRVDFKPGYSGELTVARIPSAVSCDVITNIRVTDRVIEETILLDFTILKAGVRQVRFRIPRRLATAHIAVPLLRLKTVADLPDDPDLVQVTLDLQDDVTGELRVLVQNDRSLDDPGQRVPLAVVDSGQTRRRFVVFENTGRRELICDDHAGFTALNRQQRFWQALAHMLKSQPNRAFVAEGPDAGAAFTYTLHERALVKTSGARIGLAEATVVVDDNGTYRGVQTYRVSNSTEQFLNIALPAGAQLWTARVDGEVVKPLRGAGGAAADQVSIPLVKTASGDLDYEVRLTYAGRLAQPGALGRTEFPLIHSTSINVELTQVRLLLPESLAWIDFDGTMRAVEDEGALAAGFLSYQTKQAQRLTRTLQQSDTYAKIRAGESLRRLQSQMKDFGQTADMYLKNDAFRSNFDHNAMVIEGAQQEVEQFEKAWQESDDSDNRYALDTLFETQSVSRAADVVNEIGFNFEVAPVSAEELKAAPQSFDGRWFTDNDLDKRAAPDPDGDDQHAVTLRDQLLQEIADGPAAPASQQAQAPQLRESGRRKLPRRKRKGSDDKEVALRYKAAIEKPQDKLNNAPADVLVDQAAAGGVVFGLPEHVHLAGGLSSLEVDMPQRGRLFMFTTPRGEARVSARALSRDTMALWMRLAVIAGALLAAWVARRVWQHLAHNGTAQRQWCTAVLPLCAASVICGVLPLAGVVLAIIAVVLRQRGSRLERAQWS